MTIRDREVLEELRDDPELLALADAVVETQRLRRSTPRGAVTAVAVALPPCSRSCSPRHGTGAGGTSFRARARAGRDRNAGRVVHMTIRFEESGGRRFSPVTTESFYDGRTGLVRVISRERRKDSRRLHDTGLGGRVRDVSRPPRRGRLLPRSAVFREEPRSSAAVSGGAGRSIGFGSRAAAARGSSRSGSLWRVLSRSCSEPSIPTVRRPASRRP